MTLKLLPQKKVIRSSQPSRREKRKGALGLYRLQLDKNRVQPRHSGPDAV